MLLYIISSVYASTSNFKMIAVSVSLLLKGTMKLAVEKMAALLDNNLPGPSLSSLFTQF